MQRLIIRLGAHFQAPIQWLVYSDRENEIIASGRLNNATELHSLKERASSAEIIGLAPASDMYYAKVQVPKKGARKAILAIPFMIEEELATNIETAFFALGDNKDDLQEVAVISKIKMAEWQNMFEEAGLFCTKLLPDAHCLPTSEKVALLQLDEQLLVKMPDGKYLQGEASWLLPIVLEQSKQSETALICYSEIDNWPETQEAEFDFDVLPMQLLLNGAAQQKLNLFQGDFAVKPAINPVWDKWRLAAGLAIIALCANLIYTTTELNSLKSQRADLQAQINAVGKQAFPNLRTYRKISVEREIAKLEQGGGNLSMLAMLSRLANVFETSGVKPQNIRYDNKRSELRMQSVAKSFEALDTFVRNAQSLGFEVEQRAINNRGDEVVGVIVVRG